MATRTEELRVHQEWIGYLQPVGLVVAPSALVAAGVYPERDAAARQQRLAALAELDADGRQLVADFPRLTREVFGWEAGDLVPTDALPECLAAPLVEYGETLRPTWAVPDPDAADRTVSDHAVPNAWLLLVQELPPATALDAAPEGPRHVGVGAHHGWRAAPQARFERLLREAGVPAGLLTNGHELRLVYAPRGESSGHVTFRVDDLLAPAGRPMVGALVMLLGAERLFSAPRRQRLGALLRESRLHQNTVSTELADQVLGALYELVAGFQAANDLRGGLLLGEALREAPEEVYGGLLTTLLRLVFVLYAEDRALLPADALYQQYYSVGGLFERLREDAARYPDTMDQRYGAWAQLLALFRMLHDGARSDRFHLPPRHGRLFDPDAYPFLEGRPWGDRRIMGERADPPRVSDGCVYRVLQRLLVLDGERLSYRALDVEQIGSVYEAIMGFELVVVRGTSVAVKPKTKKPGSASHAVVDLDALLKVKGAERAKHLKERADCELPATQAKALAAAASVEALVGALGSRVSPFTPNPVPPGAMLLSPTEERRRSGSHYTPRALTEPIVRTTLAPVLAALGDTAGEGPRPAQLLGLRVCDPAMGSGAFLVEACRQLGDALVTAWQRHGETPELPPDEDAGLAARRLVAQRCLYGVDRNPFAVDLAKLSLWLVTLAREHPFTFVDHALRQGDSLVGFSRRQVAAFHWGQDAAQQTTFIGQHVEERLDEARRARHVIEALGDSDDVRAKTRMLREADAALGDVRLTGDALAAAFFGAAKPKQRAERLADLKALVLGWLDGTRARGDVERVVAELRGGERSVTPFHWELEFPEVFDRKNPGFDAFVGNPPFAGKNTIIAGNAGEYLPFLQTVHPESHGNADLVAHFFRRVYGLLREGGAFGLIATNTIAQGDTRATGLRWLCTHGCTLYEARTRYRWPGHAAVVVSVVHGRKGAHAGPYRLDGRAVERITAFLFHDGGHDDPKPLAENAGRSFQGSIVLGMGFTFDDANPDEATPLAEMHRLIAADPRNAERIFPYIGGEEVNDSPTHAHRRYVINFGEMGEDEARRGWPDLMRIVEERVRPERARLGDNPDAKRRKKYWWQWGRVTPALDEALRRHERVLIIARVSNAFAFTFGPARTVFNEKVVVFPFDDSAALCTMQSRVHEVWTRFFSSSLKDDLQYTPSNCFETFPFPPGWRADAALEAAGRAYYEHRAALMVAANEGLTKTYNHFHNPDERAPGIERLRALHAEMDRAVLAAYGWGDLDLACDFFPEHEEEDEGGAEEGGAGARARRKRYRLRWPDPVRDEVLARLLALNRRRAAGVADEVPAGASGDQAVTAPALGAPSGA